MKRNFVNEINEMMENDILPDVLNFSLEEKSNLDWDKVTYNDYNSFDFFAKKFYNGWQSIKGFDKVIQEIADNSTSPLEEMNDRIKLANDIQNEEAIDAAEWVNIENFDYIFKKNI